MSQTYVIRSVVSITVPVSEQRDRVVRRLPPPLVKGIPAEEHAEILAEVLARRGWRPAGDGTLARERGSVRERVDPRSRELEITASVSEATVEVEVEVPVREGASPGEIQAALERHARSHEDADRARLAWSEAAQRAAQRDLAREIEVTEAARAAELEDVVREAEAEALKRLAPRLGRVRSVDERTVTGDYELVIKIETDD